MNPEGYSESDPAHIALGHHLRRVIDQWAGTSGHYDTSAWATQKAIQKHFGLPESTLDMGKSNMREEGWGKVEDEYQRHKPLLHHFVQAVYDDTQKRLKEKGLTHILVHRGLGSPSGGKENAPDWMRPPVKSVTRITPQQKEGHNRNTYYRDEKWGDEHTHMVHYDQPDEDRAGNLGSKTIKFSSQPASSWSTHPAIARRFADQTFDTSTASVITAKVPAERVWSTAHTGPGCLGEREAIVLGGKGEGILDHRGWWGEHTTSDPGRFQRLQAKARAPQPKVQGVEDYGHMDNSGELAEHYPKEHIHWDKDGTPYAEASHPSGWKARDYGGPYLHIRHEATEGDDAEHDLIGLGNNKDEVRENNQPGWSHQHLKDRLHEWVGEYADGAARNDPRIDRYNRRKGIRYE